MKTAKTLIATAACALAMLAPPFADAAGAVLLNENFNNVGALANWLMVNRSAPPGQPWFQGNAGIFGAQSGAADSYIGASFLSASQGFGTIDNWLITPELSFAGATQLSFFTRTQAIPGLSDMLEVRYSAGAGTDASGFTTLLATVGGASAYPADWQQFTANLVLSGSGRFAFRYIGDAALANYIGIDSVSVTTAVPEPSAYLMLCVGIAVVSLLLPRPRT